MIKTSKKKYKKKYSSKYSSKGRNERDNSLSDYDLNSFKETFKDDNFSDGHTALINSKKRLREILDMLKGKGLEKVAVLTRRIEMIYMDAKNIIKEKKYNVELSFHPHGFMDNLPMYNASLVNYYLGSESKEFSEIVFSTLSPEEGEVLGRYSLSEIEELTQLAIARGNKELAIKIYCTWKTYKKYNQ